MNLDDFTKLYYSISLQAQISFGIALIAFLLFWIAFYKTPTKRNQKR